MLRANPFGLHDVHGNVWEWCWDGYEQGVFAKGSDVDPVRGHEGTVARVFRGGSYKERANLARLSHRMAQAPDSSIGELGVRPARAIDR